MADQKLTALTAITPPLVSTDKLYVVRTGASYQTTVADVTALTDTLYQPINTGMTHKQVMARAFCRC